jgi:hypothetical protein
VRKRKRRPFPPTEAITIDKLEEYDEDVERRQPTVDPDEIDPMDPTGEYDDYGRGDSPDRANGLLRPKVDRQNGMLAQMEDDNPPLTCKESDLEFKIFNAMR